MRRREPVESVVRRMSASRARATPKSRTLTRPSVGVDEHVGGLEVAVDEPLLVGVLDGVADLRDQCEPLARAEPLFAGVSRDGARVLDQLHRDERARAVEHRRDPGLEDLRDPRVLEAAQELALVREPARALGVRRPPDQHLEGDVSLRRALLGAVDLAHAAVTEQGDHAVAGDLFGQVGRAREGVVHGTPDQVACARSSAFVHGLRPTRTTGDESLRISRVSRSGSASRSRATGGDGTGRAGGAGAPPRRCAPARWRRR